VSAAQRDKGAAAKVCAKCGRAGSLHYRINRDGATVCTNGTVCRRRRSNAATPRLSADDYAARLEAQGGGCALCGTKPKTRRLDVDHDHATGEVRGLLCHRCNRALPTWVDDRWLIAAIEYLQPGSEVLLVT